jgi:pyruvate dehydrogenase E2 component (dihydrolipoamide acetyltransferase)
MATDIIVPPLSQTGDTLVLTAWLKQVGDPVSKGEGLFEVETDKAVLVVESPGTGTLREVRAAAGSEVTIRTVIGSIGAADETPAPMEPTAPAAPNGPAALVAEAARPTPPARNGRILASPRARNLAEREGVALAAVGRATGPDGLIVERDVRAYLAERAAEPVAASAPPATPVARRMAAHEGVDLARVTPAGAVIKRADVAAALQQQTPALTVSTASRRVPLSPTRLTIARRLQQHQQEAVPVTLTRDVDATELVALRERLLPALAKEGVRPTYTDFLVSIVARCLRQHPHLNATFDGEALEVFTAVNIGLAVDTERGLLAPVLRDVAGQGLAALARARADLVARAQRGSVTPAEMSGGTFSLSNLGAQGVDAFTPLLNPPQIGILGVGRIRAVIAPFNGAPAVRQAVSLSFTFDHRAIDGAPAARFLGDVAALIEQPERIWL